jgi:hypothetical protein
MSAFGRKQSPKVAHAPLPPVGNAHCQSLTLSWIFTDDAWAVPGTARQPGPDRGRKSELTPFILSGRWDEGVQPAQKEMLDEFAEKYNLQDQDWRKQMSK